MYQCQEAQKEKTKFNFVNQNVRKAPAQTKSKSKYEAGTWSDQAAPLSREERRGRGGRKIPWESGAQPAGVIVVSLSVLTIFY